MVVTRPPSLLTTASEFPESFILCKQEIARIRFDLTTPPRVYVSIKHITEKEARLKTYAMIQSTRMGKRAIRRETNNPDHSIHHVNVFQMEDPEAPEFPGPSKYEKVCSLCGLEISYVPSTREYYVNHWRVEFGYPLGVLFIIHSSYVVLLLCHLPRVDYIGTKLLAAMMITNAMFSISYITAILVGPGYLPYFYPHNLGVTGYLSGLATTPAHEEFAKVQKPPRRCKFFRSARRVVIRPDHLCAWLASFVGKRNHKLFFLFNFWGVIYISMFTYCSLRSLATLITELDTFGDLVNYAIIVSYTILGASFLFLTGNFLQQNIRHISRNQTQFEIMKHFPKDTFSLSPWYRNWEEVFGPLSHILLWFIPVPAFWGVDDITLAASTIPVFKGT